jgi:hypothetical protein
MGRASMTLLQYLSPLSWEHINLTGDYLWRSSAKMGTQVQAVASTRWVLACFKFRFLRRPDVPPRNSVAKNSTSG